ncbi:hypothetical protein [Paratractidigestivibacter faecalis]|uniref:DUF4355 domain-containing protein n=1 Tax=Paratractidigestivibacter faecalis TaxID=2292441 RepID=A0ABV1IDN8_9ACTN
MSELKPIETQEQLDAVLKERLERAERKAAERFGDYDELKAKADEYDRAQEASKTELQKAQDKAAKAEAALKAMKDERERAAAVAKAAEENGVDAGLLARMSGDVAENAKFLASMGGRGKAYPQTRDKGDSRLAGKQDPCLEAARMAFGRK